MNAARFLPALVFVGLILPALPPAGADGEAWSARLAGLRVSYGDESWKYDTATQPPTSPTALLWHAQNQTVSYASAVGLLLTVDLDIYSTGDETPDCDGPTGTRNYGVTGRIQTPRGPLDAYVQATGNDCIRFTLLFDLDGSNHADAQGHASPPLAPGPQTIEVAVFKRVNDNPPSVRVGDASFRFTYVQPYQQVEAPGLEGRPYQQEVPDQLFRLYTDIGWDRSVRAILRPLDASSTIQLGYDFDASAQGQSVALQGFLARRVTPTGDPSPVSPPAPGLPVIGDNRSVSGLTENLNRLVEIDAFPLARGLVDEDGHASFVVSGRALLRDDAAGVYVVAPLLESNFQVRDCPGDCAGGDQFRVGATELVVPVIRDVPPAPVAIHAFDLAQAPSSPSGLPGAVGEAVQSVNALEVFVRDPAFVTGSAPPSGDLFAIVSDVRSPAALGSASLAPSQSEPQMLVGEVPVRNIQAERVFHYRVLAMLYSNDVLRGMAVADRGYSLGVEAPVALVPPGAGGLFLNFTSRTTDHDGTQDESGYGIQVVYQVTSPGLAPVTGRLTLAESATQSVFVPVTSGQAGRVTLSINSTSGDVLPLAREVALDFEEAPDKESLADRIPGFEAGMLVIAALVGLVALRRRHA